MKRGWRGSHVFCVSARLKADLMTSCLLFVATSRRWPFRDSSWQWRGGAAVSESQSCPVMLSPYKSPHPKSAGSLFPTYKLAIQNRKCRVASPRLKLASPTTASQAHRIITFTTFTEQMGNDKWLIPSLVLFLFFLHALSTSSIALSSFISPKTNTNRFSCFYTTTTHLTLSIASVC